MAFDFTAWKNRDHHIGKVFIEDGIVNLESWNKADTKILFLAKEAYGDESYDLREEIRDNAPYNNWKTVADWTYATTHILSKGVIPDFRPKDELGTWEQGNEWLRKVALVNVKKSQGKSSSDYDDLKSYVESDKDLLRIQINDIDPDIVFCCYTFEDGYYNSIYEINKEDLVVVSDWCLHHKINGKTRLVINFWHFAGQFHRGMAYFALCGALMKYKSRIK